jgi:uncharacterized OB-fold protein
MAITHPIELVTGLNQVHGDMPVTDLYTAGVAGEIFLRELKAGRLVGSQTSKGVVYLPPRLYCEETFERLTEVTPILEGDAKLASFTVCRIDMDLKPLDPPVVIGFVTWPEPVKGGLVHYILGEPETLEIGMQLRPQWKPEAERQGSILDLEGFQPV